MTVTTDAFVVYERDKNTYDTEVVLHRAGCPAIKNKETSSLDSYGMYEKVCGRCKPDTVAADLIVDRVMAEYKEKAALNHARSVAAADQRAALFVPLVDALKEVYPDSTYDEQIGYSEDPEEAVINLRAEPGWERLVVSVVRRGGKYKVQGIDHSSSLIKSSNDARLALAFITKVENFVDYLNDEASR